MKQAPDTHIRIWCERSNGFDFGADPGCRKFEVMAHWFKDFTHLPAPTIDTKATRIVIERRPMPVWLKNTPSAGFGQPPISAERNPAPTVMASGIGGVAIHQHYIEDDGIVAPRPASNKPPYAVPTMEAIRAMPWNGFNVVSTFAGGGGSSTGYRMAGFRVLYANEFVDMARETYAANKAPYTILDGRDIREVTAEDILAKIGLQAGQLDIFDGSPPCSSFSTAGKREKLWGQEKQYSDDKVQRTDDLFYEYARLLKGLQPKVFVAENVKGLLIGSAIGYFKRIHAALSEAGYRVEARLLNAKWLGVPQSRERAIFVGVRKDLGMDPVFPTPDRHFYTIADAIPWLRTGAVPSGFEGDMTGYAVGHEWNKLLPGQQSEKYFQLVRPDPNQAAPTITAAAGGPSVASVTHPYERRKFTIPELKRLCSFPDDWIVEGTFAQQWERCGRAVPPVMMSRIAGAIRDGILAPLAAKAA